MPVKCADCGFLAVRHLETQQLVSPLDQQRSHGVTPSSATGKANIAVRPICADGAKKLADRDLTPADFTKATQLERDCRDYTAWIPALTPKEHLDVTILERQRLWQSEQADKLNRHNNVHLGLSMVAVLISLIALFRPQAPASSQTPPPPAAAHRE